MKYQVNSPNVVFEDIEGEIVVVHLVHGLYFSLRDSGAEIWREIVSGTPQESLGQQLQFHLSASSEQIQQAAERLLAQLLAEELLVATSQVATVPRPRPAQPAAYQEPVLERFQDMQELLVLDPIHEVDPQSGWPHQGG